MNLPCFLMHVHWCTTMQDFRGLQGDKSKFWVEFLRGYSKNYPFETHSNWLFPVLIRQKIFSLNHDAQTSHSVIKKILWSVKYFRHSELFTANQIREITFSHMEKTFHPIMKNLSEVLSFRWEKPCVCLQNLSQETTKLNADHWGPFLS